MRVVLLGPPGAGKGTHAKVLAEHFGLAHLAAGDCLRRHIRENTELGRKAKDIIDRGELVPDDLVNAMMAEEIGSSVSGITVLYWTVIPERLIRQKRWTIIANGRG